MWCFRMWSFEILVLSPSFMSALGVKYPQLQLLRVDINYTQFAF